jgi:hypothetical protein
MYSIIRGSFGVDNITKRNANHSFDEPFTVVIDNITNQENLDWPFLIAPSVFSNVYLQFLWIVHF